MPDTAIYKNIIDDTALKECISSYFDSFKEIDRLKNAERIIIKVTLPSLQKSSSVGIMTKIDFFTAIYDNVRKYNKNSLIYVVESNFSGNVTKIFQEKGFIDFARTDDKLILTDIDSTESLKITSNKFRKLGIVCVPEILLDYDFFINVSTARRHIFERYTGAIAGMVSLLNDKFFRKRISNYMSQTAADVNALFEPDMTFIDARTVLEGAGPIQGEPVQKNIVIASSDNYSADCIGARIIGENEFKVPHIRYFSKRNKLKKLSADIFKNGGGKTAYIPFLQYFIWRSSIFLNRLGDFFQRTAYLGQLGSFALMVTGFTDIVSGKWISIPNVATIFCDMLFKLNISEDLTDKRIVINKHIKDQVVS